MGLEPILRALNLPLSSLKSLPFPFSLSFPRGEHMSSNSTTGVSIFSVVELGEDIECSPRMAFPCHGLKEPRSWSRKEPILLSGCLTTARRKSEQKGKRRQGEDKITIDNFQETDQEEVVVILSLVFFHLSLSG